MHLSKSLFDKCGFVLNVGGAVFKSQDTQDNERHGDGSLDTYSIYALKPQTCVSQETYVCRHNMAGGKET